MVIDAMVDRGRNCPTLFNSPTLKTTCYIEISFVPAEL